MADPEEQTTEESETASESLRSQILAALESMTDENESVEENEAGEQEITQEIETRVIVSSDGMSAFLSLSAEPEEPYPFTTETILQALNERGVVEGILVEEIHEIVNRQSYVTDLLVAKGQTPDDGEDARIEFLFDPSPKPYSQEMGDRVDWREINLIQRVVENQPVARKIPAREGVAGLTVTGKKVEPRKVRDTRLPAGQGTKVDESDSDLLLAAIAGSVRFAVNQVVVDKVLSVPRDVDFSVGNIDIDGGVHIGGNILPGFHVRATGDVHVEGCVESATIDAGGSVCVVQGILGQENKTVVSAGKDVSAKFATNAVIRAGGDINIQWEAVNCRLESGGAVAVGSPAGAKGRIAGGEVFAATAIRAVDVGAPSGTATILNITLSTMSTQNQEVHEVTERISKLRGQHEKVVAEVAKLLQLRVTNDPSWSESNAELLSRLSAAAQQIEEQVRELENQLKESREKLQVVEEPKVTVRGTIFPGVKMTIGRATRSFYEKLERVQVVLTDDHSRLVTISK